MIRRSPHGPGATGSRGRHDIRQWQGTEVQRALILGLLAAGAAYLMIVLPLLVLTPPSAASHTVALALLAVVPLAGVGVATWLLHRTHVPAVRGVLWFSRQNERRVRGVLGGAAPASADEVLDRLAGRADDEAVAVAVHTLWSGGRRAEARDRLLTWEPGDEIAAARRVRWLAGLAYDDGEPGELEEARVAAERIPNPDARTEQLAAIEYERGRRLLDLERDPTPAFAAAARLLGAERCREVETDDDRRAWAKFHRSLLLMGLVPSLAILLLAAISAAGLLG